MPAFPKLAGITMDIADEDSVYWKLGVCVETVTTTAFFEEPNMISIESIKKPPY